MLPDLVLELARDASTTGRGRLLSTLSGAVLSGRGVSARELEIFFDIARRILPEAAGSDRHGFSVLVAERTGVPYDLLLCLARDEIVVAEPVLLRARALTDPDLAEIVRDRDDPHRLAIAGREAVSSSLAITLVDYGGREVLHRLGGNPGVEFDDALRRELGRRAATDRDLLEILVVRDEERRHRAAPPIPVDVRPPASALVAGPAAPAKPAARTAGGDMRVDALLQEIRTGKRSVDAAVCDVADKDRHTDLAALLAAIAGIDDTQVMRVLVRADANGIAVLARGLDLTAETYARIVELRRRRLRLDAQKAKWEREHFAELDREEARAIIAGLAGARRTG